MWEGAQSSASPASKSTRDAIALLKQLANQGPSALFGSGPRHSLSSRAQNAVSVGASVMSWTFGEGQVGSASIYRKYDYPFGHFTARGGDGQPNAFIFARSLLAGPLMRQVLNCTDDSEERALYFRQAAHVLGGLYPTRYALMRGLMDCWKVAADLVTCPAGWRASMAYAAFFITHKKVRGLPYFDIDHTPVPELSKSQAQLDGDLVRAFSHEISQAVDWYLAHRFPLLDLVDFDEVDASDLDD